MPMDQRLLFRGFISFLMNIFFKTTLLKRCNFSKFGAKNALTYWVGGNFKKKKKRIQ